MKTHIATKPYYIITKNDKFVAESKIVLGRKVVTSDKVEWFNTEAEQDARLAVVKSKPITK